MPHYRITVRIGKPGRQYHMADVEAGSLRAALAQALAVFPDDGDAGDLLEIRLQRDAEERAWTPG